MILFNILTCTLYSIVGLDIDTNYTLILSGFSGDTGDSLSTSDP